MEWWSDGVVDLGFAGVMLGAKLIPENP